uniref:Uncharacterized protein n=1 Tax=Manihot esculenta TaxID=3983 RepID=A0A2C9W9D7_MANES
MERRCCPQRFEVEGGSTKCTETSTHCQSWFCRHYYIKGRWTNFVS